MYLTKDCIHFFQPKNKSFNGNLPLKFQQNHFGRFEGVNNQTYQQTNRQTTNCFIFIQRKGVRVLKLDICYATFRQLSLKSSKTCFETTCFIIFKLIIYHELSSKDT